MPTELHREKPGGVPKPLPTWASADEGFGARFPLCPALKKNTALAAFTPMAFPPFSSPKMFHINPNPEFGACGVRPVRSQSAHHAARQDRRGQDRT